MEGKAATSERDMVSLRHRVEEALSRIRPALMADGGDVQLIDVVGGVVMVKLLGACSGCPYAPDTLKHGIEAFLRVDVPGVHSVRAISARL